MPHFMPHDFQYKRKKNYRCEQQNEFNHKKKIISIFLQLDAGKIVIFGLNIFFVLNCK